MRLLESEAWSREEPPKTAKALSSSMCVPPFYYHFSPYALHMGVEPRRTRPLLGLHDDGYA
jgi:hypothetical protein